MSYISINELLGKSDSVYKLVILASKRAIELNQGAQKLVETNSQKPQVIAVEEIMQKKIAYKEKKI